MTYANNSENYAKNFYKTGFKVVYQGQHLGIMAVMRHWASD
jgi:hypothetical protein